MTHPSDATGRSRSRQRLRTELTRTALLRSAEKVFARDGFEASRIEDIAADAGRTRGAFYANYQNKAEVFLALRSRVMRRRARELKERIDKVSGDEARLEAISRYVIEQVCDSETLLLEIEFKLFALRRPEMLADLAEKHLDASSSVHHEELPELFPEHSRALADMRRNTLAIESVLEGFGLNILFSPNLLGREYLERIVPELLAGILPHGSERTSSG